MDQEPVWLPGDTSRAPKTTLSLDALVTTERRCFLVPWPSDPSLAERRPEAARPPEDVL